MADIHLDFTPPLAHDDADLVVMLPDTSVARFRHLSLSVIRDTCPLLFHTFEEGINIPHQASIEVTSIAVVTAFLRFLYQRDYLPPGEDVQCSLLLHAEVSKMAEDYSVPELQVIAYVNFVQATELSCSFPTPPLGLCEAIQFIYAYLACDQSRQQQSLVDALLNYCLSSFTYHGLGENQHFRQVVYDTPMFHKHLCETSMTREFLDDGAADIIRLPVCRPQPHSHYSLLTRGSGDLHLDPFFDYDSVQSPEKHGDTALETRREPIIEEGLPLVFRPKHVRKQATIPESESCSDDEGYMLVHPPRLTTDNPFAASSPIDGAPYSPELVSATPSEDEWSYEAISADENTPLLRDPVLDTPKPVNTPPQGLMEISDDEWSLI